MSNIKNEMNLTAAELRREYVKVLKALSETADERDTLRARAEQAEFRVSELEKNNRRLQRLWEALPTQFCTMQKGNDYGDLFELVEQLIYRFALAADGRLYCPDGKGLWFPRTGAAGNPADGCLRCSAPFALHGVHDTDSVESCLDCDLLPDNKRRADPHTAIADGEGE